MLLTETRDYFSAIRYNFNVSKEMPVYCKEARLIRLTTLRSEPTESTLDSGRVFTT